MILEFIKDCNLDEILFLKYAQLEAKEKYEQGGWDRHELQEQKLQD